jgi:hypothetical protein
MKMPYSKSRHTMHNPSQLSEVRAELKDSYTNKRKENIALQEQQSLKVPAPQKNYHPLAISSTLFPPFGVPSGFSLHPPGPCTPSHLSSVHCQLAASLSNLLPLIFPLPGHLIQSTAPLQLSSAKKTHNWFLSGRIDDNFLRYCGNRL